MLGNFAWIKVLSSTKDSQTKATAKLVCLEAQFKNHPIPGMFSDFPQ